MDLGTLGVIIGMGCAGGVLGAGVMYFVIRWAVRAQGPW